MVSPNRRTRHHKMTNSIIILSGMFFVIITIYIFCAFILTCILLELYGRRNLHRCSVCPEHTKYP